MDTKIKASFWDDEAIGKLVDAKDPEALVAVFWLMTANINHAGWVDFSPRVFVFQTGVDVTALQRGCDALGRGVVKHERGFWMRHFIRHQFGTGNSLAANSMSASVLRAFDHMPEEIIAEVGEQYPELIRSVKPRKKQAPREGGSGGLPPTGEEKRREEQRRTREKFGFPADWSEHRSLAVLEFIAFRSQIHKPMKPASFPAWVKKFAAVDDATLAATLQESIANGWQGVFPERLPLPPPGSFFGKKREGAAPPPAANPYEVPPCAEWKKIGRRIAQGLGLDESQIDELDWKQIAADARLAVWDEFKKGGSGA